MEKLDKVKSENLQRTNPPRGSWAANPPLREADDTVRAFENLQRHAIPQHDVMREACDALTLRYSALVGDDVPKVVDAGCGVGGAIAGVVGKLPDAEFVGLDLSVPMFRAATSRFAGKPNVEVIHWDLLEGLPKQSYKASVVLFVLALNYIPMNRRARVLKNFCDILKPHGALVVVDKVMGPGVSLSDSMFAVYHEEKRRARFAAQELERKRFGIAPSAGATDAWTIESTLRGCGFREVDCFFRWMNFAGWVAIK